MTYVEQREFILRLDLRCAFPEDYDGEADGYAWVEDFRPIASEILAAAAAAFRRQPGWTLRPANRGRPSDEEVTLIAERTISGTAGTAP